jgi:hypothetical protein
MNGLHVCLVCGSKLVQLSDLEVSDGDRSWLTLRCPECESVSYGEFDNSAVEELERELERGEQELGRLLAALEADAIQPIDF